MQTHYQSSTGPKVIADMQYDNLKAALAKLRDGAEVRKGAGDTDPRADEIEAMAAELAKRDAEYAARDAEAGQQ